MIEKQFDYETLRNIAKSKKGKVYVAELEQYYLEKYDGKPINALLFSDYDRYWEDGNRVDYEAEYFDRRNRLYLLQTLALAKPKYLKDLENVIGAVCDEYTWVLPAHAYVPIDLLSSETSAQLAETAYVFKDKLSPRLIKRVKDSIERQIVHIYESTEFWWERKGTNNWGAVCACGVGLTYMYMFSERFANIKERLFSTFQNYIDSGIDDEGYCEEGVAYWQYGFGKFCEFFEVYVHLYGERPSIVDCDKLKKTLSYYDNARMNQNVYIPFADGGSKHFDITEQVCMAIKGLYGKDFVLPLTRRDKYSHSSSGLFFLYNIGTLPSEVQKKEEKETSVYYKSAQVFVRRRKNYAFAAKCGNNDESHNHNDVGTFQIVKNGERYICDIGAGEYTKDYFSPKRYEIFVNNAYSHSIPIVDGIVQIEGKEYCGKVLSTDKNSISMDISSAYKDFNGKICVTYTTKEDCVEVIYECGGVQSNVAFRFVSDIKPIVKKDGVHIRDMVIVCEQGFNAKTSVVKYSPHEKGEKESAYIVEYKAEKSGNFNAKFIFKFKK